MEAAILNLSNDIKEVFVWEFSRISRIGRYAEYVRNFLTDQNINLETKKEEYSLFDSDGKVNMHNKMMFDMWKNISEEEGEKRIARLKRGKKAAAQKNR
jgi:DNA invertase Pin-like site-specific DNA recombinase